MMNLQLVYRCILSLSKNENMFYEKNKTKGLLQDLSSRFEDIWKVDERSINTRSIGLRF